MNKNFVEQFKRTFLLDIVQFTNIQKLKPSSKSKINTPIYIIDLYFLLIKCSFSIYLGKRIFINFDDIVIVKSKREIFSKKISLV